MLVALPLTSILAVSWLYAETRDNMLVTRLARDIVLLVPGSLLFFLPFLLETKTRLGFVPNLLVRAGAARAGRLGDAPGSLVCSAVGHWRVRCAATVRQTVRGGTGRLK